MTISLHKMKFYQNVGSVSILGLITVQYTNVFSFPLCQEKLRGRANSFTLFTFPPFNSHG